MGFIKFNDSPDSNIPETSDTSAQTQTPQSKNIFPRGDSMDLKQLAQNLLSKIQEGMAAIEELKGTMEQIAAAAEESAGAAEESLSAVTEIKQNAALMQKETEKALIVIENFENLIKKCC